MYIGHVYSCPDLIINIVNSLRPRQNRRHFADDVFKCNLLNESVWISIENSLRFVPKGPINNIPALVQIMAWRRSGDKPLSEPIMVSLLAHICVTRPQWVKIVWLWNWDIWKFPFRLYWYSPNSTISSFKGLSLYRLILWSQVISSGFNVLTKFWPCWIGVRLLYQFHKVLTHWDHRLALHIFNQVFLQEMIEFRLHLSVPLGD